jgi:hypothetical protein
MDWYKFIVGKAYGDLKDPVTSETLTALDGGVALLAGVKDLQNNKEYADADQIVRDAIEAGKNSGENKTAIEKEQKTLQSASDEVRQLKSVMKAGPRQPETPAVGMVISMIAMLIAGTSYKFGSNGFKATTPAPDNKEMTMQNFYQVVEFLGVKDDQQLDELAPKSVMERARILVNAVSSVTPVASGEPEFLGYVNAFLGGAQK